MYEEELDITKLRYVLYARKSTEDESRQIRSIPDQIFDCRILRDRIGLNVVKTIEESKSAKKPNRRPEFTQLLKDIKAKKYDGILAWHPDRLARNMKEGGEIIDMIDEGYIKDLKFVTHHFTNDASGKMLLGMSFVLSKQYSDDLSQKVKRGVRRQFSEGRSSKAKHGYIRKDNFYEPDGKNFNLICWAWELRAENESLRTIAEKMNKKGYGRILKKTGRKVIMDKRILSSIFRDPFYYGILVQANKSIDLREIAGYNFIPSTDEETYNYIQNLTRGKYRPSSDKRRGFYPLKGIASCSYCGKPFVVAPSKGHKRYLYYRCDNTECKRQKKSVRGKVIFEFIYKFLEEGLKFTEKEYQNYLDELKKVSEKQKIALITDLKSKQGKVKYLKNEVNDLALRIIKVDQKSGLILKTGVYFPNIS